MLSGLDMGDRMSRIMSPWRLNVTFMVSEGTLLGAVRDEDLCLGLGHD